MKKPRGWNNSGTFALGNGKQAIGSLSLKGRKTLLSLSSEDESDFLPRLPSFIQGTMFDLTKVSLIDCVQVSSQTIRDSTGRRRAFADAFPHYVLHGDRHIDPEDEVISAVSFSLDDLEYLCYDFDAFGRSPNPELYISTIVEAASKQAQRTIEVGPNPQIAYFTGKNKMFSIETNIGRLEANHLLNLNLGGPAGAWIKNKMGLTLEFTSGINFSTAISRMHIVLKYVGLLVGRPSNVLRVAIRLQSAPDQLQMLEVYWPLYPERELDQDGEKPHPGDVLLSPIFHLGSFEMVTRNWFSRQTDWGVARLRFFDSFSQQFSYDIDRLIRSVNMFDILPDSAVPRTVPISEELEVAKNDARKAFRALPHSVERGSILGALGRIGLANLKQKVRHRAEMVIKATGTRFPDLLTITDQAVNARNFFVHGSGGSFDYAEHQSVLWFFAETLEFVFGCSDLLEGGWDMETWLSKGTTMSHPFGRYRVNYNEGLASLKNALGSQS